MTGLDEVQEKLEEARLIILRGAHGEKARVAMRRGAVDNIDKALALMESEQGEQMRKDHAAMEALRGYAATGACPVLVFDGSGSWALTFAGTQPVVEKPDGAATSVLRATWATDPADAILVDPRSEEAEGE